MDGQDTFMHTRLWVPPANFDGKVVGEIVRRHLPVAQETLGEDHRIVFGVYTRASTA